MDLQVLETNRSTLEPSKSAQIMVLEYFLLFLMDLQEMSRLTTWWIIDKTFIRLLPSKRVLFQDKLYKRIIDFISLRKHMPILLNMSRSKRDKKSL